ncbi:hypothetical protein GGR54DRAFT_603980 [Hypoxylon sp. NC1633]|nr:hypothetical protein GGR54DRAFT_603980 [Hypoxylon sp. NC1633]
MGLRFQATVLLSALLPSVLATGTFEEQCAIPSGIGGVIGDTCNPLALSETVSDAATVTSFSKRDGELTTFTTWPDATLVPVTTYVPVPQASLIPCTAWFFWICSEWDSAKGDIGGWQLALPPGVYPPGPPEFELPDGFDFDGDLPSWPALTIGTDNIPTFSSRPTSCETTQTATLYISTTSYAVSISSSATVTSTVTTTTSVIDTSSVILGCEAEPSSTSTPTMPTLTPTSTAVLTTLPITPVSDSSCVSTVTTSVCAIPSQPCQPSLSCAEWTATASSSSSTSTPESTPIPTSTTETTVASTSTTSSAASPTATWHFTMVSETNKHEGL